MSDVEVVWERGEWRLDGRGEESESDGGVDEDALAEGGDAACRSAPPAPPLRPRPLVDLRLARGRVPVDVVAKAVGVSPSQYLAVEGGEHGGGADGAVQCDGHAASRLGAWAAVYVRAAILSRRGLDRLLSRHPSVMTRGCAAVRGISQWPTFGAALVDSLGPDGVAGLRAWLRGLAPRPSRAAAAAACALDSAIPVADLDALLGGGDERVEAEVHALQKFVDAIGRASAATAGERVVRASSDKVKRV